MSNHFLIVNNEDGSAIVMALLALAVLSILGVSSINTSIIELQISRNEQIYQTNFYQAEGAVMEGGQRLAIESNIDEIRPDITTKSWIVGSDLDLEDVIIFLSNDTSALVSSGASFSANAQGIVSGASLDMTGDSNIYGFKIYGYSMDNNGNVVITIGYKKRM